jgi:hypothetical protein
MAVPVLDCFTEENAEVDIFHDALIEFNQLINE